jgi:hypothetical protein
MSGPGKPDVRVGDIISQRGPGASLIQLSGWLPPETLFRWHNWAVLGAFATP